MARYDVFANPSGNGFLLSLQSDLLDGLNTAVVAPLLPRNAAPSPAQRLNPVFEIDGEPYVMATQFIAAVPTAILTHRLTNLKDEADNISNALDMLFYGF